MLQFFFCWEENIPFVLCIFFFQSVTGSTGYLEFFHHWKKIDWWIGGLKLAMKPTPFSPDFRFMWDTYNYVDIHLIILINASDEAFNSFSSSAQSSTCWLALTSQLVTVSPKLKKLGILLWCPWIYLEWNNNLHC